MEEKILKKSVIYVNREIAGTILQNTINLHILS